MSVVETEDGTELGRATDLEIIERLVELDSRTIVDVGCGNGAVSAELAARGAIVLGLEPDPIQAAKNRDADPIPNVTLVEGSAESIPRESGAVDAVIFGKSLHHVPKDLMDSALREAARVLKPGTGVLYSLEPDMRGAFSQLMKPFHDETRVRAWAQEALTRTADPLFEDVVQYWYEITIDFPDFDGFAQRALGATYNDIDADKVRMDGVRQRFEAGKSGDGYSFDNLMRVRLYRGPKTAG